MKFSEKKIKVPNHDCDLVLVFPSGKEITIQARPSNADVDYNGSLDIILPEDQVVTNWKGDNMEPAPASKLPQCRKAKQLVMELP